ncbi:MAG: cobalamin biosynthesis protein [Spirochaetaceae bacterium]|nr:cobalamin biosynthesis protein [Spirochaetaceae bacterium]
MTITLFAFTDSGRRLREHLASLLIPRGHRVLPAAPGSLAEGAARAFREGDALVFIGACGIALRAVAPLVASKDRDPAVVVIDETARWVISLLSGHLGGANDLTREIAVLLGGEAVITTATDLRGLFAVDCWAKQHNLAIDSLEKAKEVSARILAGEEIPLYSDYPISGPVPRGIRMTADREGPFGIAVSLYRKNDAWLRLVPRCLYLGIGCRKGAGEEALLAAVEAALDRRRLDAAGIAGVGTVDLKAEEPALVRLCEKRGWPLQAFSPARLMELTGETAFASSEFVRTVTGADNVCERAAVLASGEGRLCLEKFARSGVTVAAAEGEAILRFDGEAL